MQVVVSETLEEWQLIRLTCQERYIFLLASTADVGGLDSKILIVLIALQCVVSHFEVGLTCSLTNLLVQYGELHALIGLNVYSPCLVGYLSRIYISTVRTSGAYTIPREIYIRETVLYGSTLYAGRNIVANIYRYLFALLTSTLAIAWDNLIGIGLTITYVLVLPGERCARSHILKGLYQNLIAIDVDAHVATQFRGVSCLGRSSEGKIYLQCSLGTSSSGEVLYRSRSHRLYALGY